MRAPRVMMPWMYSAARPRTTLGGAVTDSAGTRSTSSTASTTTATARPSASSTMVRVSSFCGAPSSKRLRRSITGTTAPCTCSTPSRNRGALGSGEGAS